MRPRPMWWIRRSGSGRPSEVGELIMSRLKDIDTVAYIRFASVYRDFKDVSEFKQELEELLSGKDQEEEIS